MKQVHVASAVFMLLLCGLFVQAQQTVATNTNVAVPPLVNFSGVLTDLNGKPLSGVVGVTFLLYKDQQGGSPLWMETQNVQPDSRGHYTVMLGSTSSSGLPSDIFVAGEAHWLGVQVEGEAEQPRVLLVSAPYALKAGDAETIGGLPPSAFVLAAPPASTAAAVATVAVPNAVAPSTTSDVTTTGGTVNALPLWTTGTNIQSSGLVQTGSGSTAKFGIGTTAPAVTLDVRGTIHGAMTLPTTGTATASAGKDSQPLGFQGSVFNSSTSTAVAQTFVLQAEPFDNDTSSASGTLNLLYASGSATPAETGMKISSKGLISFASGQTFPGTGDGTVTSVGSGAGLAGGPITGSGSLSIATGGVTNAMLANPSLTVTAGTDLTGGGSVALGGTTTLNVNTAALNAVYPQLAASNTFTGTQTIKNTTTITGTNTSGVLQVTNTTTSGGAPAVVGTADSTGASGVKGLAPATSGTTNGVFGVGASTSGFGVQGDSPNVGVYGQSDGASTTGVLVGNLTGIWGDTGGPSNSSYVGVTGTADENLAGLFENNSSTNDTVSLENDAESSSTATVLETFGGSFAGECTMDVSGDLACTGSKSAVVKVDGGSRRVKLYAVEAPENWFEDAGSGQLANGAARIELDSTFAQTVNTGMEYHVFLTPKGDCEGLYVANETAQGFEVHELRGGHSSIAFDYRIMAKRVGYENVRLADVTERFQKMQEQREIRRQRAAQLRAKSATGPVAAAAVSAHK
jgi:hypothetical protein